jgi:hypothetical protein
MDGNAGWYQVCLRKLVIRVEVILTLVAFPLVDGSTALVASAKFVKSTIPYAHIRRTLVQ